MADRILVFYGSYRSDRMGIRLADYVVVGLRARGENAELVDAKAIGLPMLDRMYKEYGPGSAPQALQGLAAKFVRPMPSCSLLANTIGECNQA